MPQKTILSERDIEDIRNLRGVENADYTKKKYAIGTTRLRKIWDVVDAEHSAKPEEIPDSPEARSLVPYVGSTEFPRNELEAASPFDIERRLVSMERMLLSSIAEDAKNETRLEELEQSLSDLVSEELAQSLSDLVSEDSIETASAIFGKEDIEVHDIWKSIENAKWWLGATFVAYTVYKVHIRDLAIFAKKADSSTRFVHPAKDSGKVSSPRPDPFASPQRDSFYME